MRIALIAFLLVLIVAQAKATATGIDEAYIKPESEGSWGRQIYNKIFGREEFGKSYAVVIGISAYSGGIKPLEQTAGDALKMRDFLVHEAGFDHVHLLTEDNATLGRIRELMEDELPDMIGPNDRFLFYWSGHGEDIEVGGGRAIGYLPTVDAKPRKTSKMISMSQIDRWDLRLKARHALFLLDVCSSGLAGVEEMGLNDDLAQAEIERLSLPGHHLLTAGTGRQKTIAHPKWQGSIFTYALLKGLRGAADTQSEFPRDGVVSFLELERYVKKQVYVERRDIGFEGRITPHSEPLRPDNEGAFFFVTNQKKTASFQTVDTTPTGEFQHGKPLYEVKGKLPETLAAAPVIPARQAKLRLSKPEWQLAQQALAELGYSPGPNDGIPGKWTELAVAKWQLEHGRAGAGSFSGRDELLELLKQSQKKQDLAQAPAVRRPIETEPVIKPAVGVFQGHQPFDTFRDCVHCPEMVMLPAGKFLMGSPASEKERSDDEGPQHEVTISEPFSIGKTEVTFDEYDRFAEATGRKKPGDRNRGRGNRPVINVSWDDATAYCGWLGDQTGKIYRLPAEAEWEYAARAGTVTRFSFGETITPDQVNYEGDYPYGAGKKGEYRKKTVPTGSLPANAWGLHEMHGNAWEWTEDWYHDSYQGAPNDGSAWLSPPGSERVVRGGFWGNGARFARAAARYAHVPGEWLYYLGLGFRCARVQEEA